MGKQMNLITADICLQINEYNQTFKDDLTVPERNIALLGPEGSGLEEWLKGFYNPQKKDELLNEKLIVTDVTSFPVPKQPEAVFHNLYRSAKNALDSVHDKGTILNDLDIIPLNQFTEHDYDTAKYAFKNFSSELKSAGYKMIFVYTQWENFTFTSFSDHFCRDIHSTLRELSYGEDCIRFVVATPYGLVGPYGQSSFADSFKKLTAPFLSEETIGKIVEPYKGIFPKGLKYTRLLQLLTNGNLKLMEYFLEFESWPDVKGIDDLKPVQDSQNVSSLFERWCAHLLDISTYDLQSSLPTLVEGNTSDASTFFQETGLYPFCLSFKLFLRKRYKKITLNP